MFPLGCLKMGNGKRSILRKKKNTLAYHKMFSRGGFSRRFHKAAFCKGERETRFAFKSHEMT